MPGDDLGDFWLIHTRWTLSFCVVMVLQKSTSAPMSVMKWSINEIEHMKDGVTLFSLLRSQTTTFLQAW
jgi:hypothetical protein